MKVKHLNENQAKFLDSAETDAAAVAEFSKKEPKYESMNDIPAGWKKDEKTLNRYTYWDNDFFASASVSNSMQDPRNVMTIIQILDKRNPDNSKEIIEHVRVEDVEIDFDKVLFDTVRRANVLLSQLRETTRMKHVTEDYLDSAEFRIQRYEDDIPELFHKVHDGYMNGMVNAKAYADVLAKIYSILQELDYVDEPLKEGYIDTHEGVAHVDTLDLMAALKSVVREYGHMELVTPIRCEMKNDDHGRRLALIPTTNEGLVEDSKVKNSKFSGTTNEAAENDFMAEEKKDISEFDSHTGKLEDIEFVMTEYIADSLLIEFVKKVDATTWLVGVEDEVVTVKFDPSWSEYVYTIDGKGPYSHRSYEYISRDVYDFVMANRTDNSVDLDDDYDDLSSFNECSDVKRADTLYGVERNESLTEERYTDTNGIMGRSGATYSDADLRKAWEDCKDSDPSMQAYNGDFDAWKKDTIDNMSKNEAFDLSHSPDLSNLCWQVASHLDADALGEDKWIEFICDDPRDTTGGKKSMRFEAIGEDAHMYGFIRTTGDAVDVHFRNGSEAICHSVEEIARFIAGEFGISI